jgi:glucokinase
MPYVLAGDIGGTKTLLCLSNLQGELKFEQSNPIAAYDSLIDILKVFLLKAGGPKISAACLALVAPVNGRLVKLTNLPCVVDAESIQTSFGFDVTLWRVGSRRRS